MMTEVNEAALQRAAARRFLLSPDMVVEHGISADWRVGFRSAVRWSDLDAFGHVSHRSHLVWCEEARNAYFLVLGEPPFAVDRPGPVMRELFFSYDRPLGPGEDLITTVRAARIGTTSLRLEYAVWCRGLIGTGHSIAIWYVNATRERVPLPAHLLTAMMRLDGVKVQDKHASRS